MELNDKTEHQRLVEEFMLRAGQDVPVCIDAPPEKVRILRAKLIFEEALETIKGLGVQVRENGSNHIISNGDCSFEIHGEFDIIETVDGCCDIRVVTTGTLSACGIPDAKAQRMVDESNLQKFGPGGHAREDGKWIKPSDWQPPQLADLIELLA